MDDASVEPMVMPLGLLREITNGFCEERTLGSGSFGKVYKGVYQDGKKIAVKMLYDMPGLDDKQFQNEFKNLTRLRHQNIVRLVGYCHDTQEVQVQYEGKLVLAEKTHRALCLEFMSNGSLEKFLSDKCDRYDWHTCYRIIKGISQGLKYLHTELIYHLDLKPANVLLDENMVPRIADFGISRLFSKQTWVTNRSLGTHGYAPPEFTRSYLISNKFDIFSLGVVIIKMMAGRAGYFTIDDMSSQEFTNLVQENWTDRLLETSKQRNAYSEQVKICIQIGLSCVQEDRHKRPTIQDIVYRLEESETKCTAAARKDWLLIFQEAKMHKTTNALSDIDGFKIVGDSRLESTLKCVVPTNGTMHYKFQWVRCLEHGNTQPIEGATTYDYMVTADDVGTLLAVYCTPVDKDRREGDLVRVFADSESKITCGEGIPPLSQQQSTVLAALQRQSVSAISMLRQEPYRESATVSGSNAKNIHLRFLNGLKTPIYTEKSIKSESNSTIRIGIFDGDGNMITEGPLSKVKVEMLVLRGDFCNDGRESWTEEEFNSHIAQGRHGQGSVVGGDCSVWLNNGEASFGGAIRFKEGSSRTRSRMFIVAARVCMDGKTADRVREAVMEPVTVLDRRNEANEKRHPPKLDDEVYRLEEISKDGTYHRRLRQEGIFTVQDFLKALNKDANKLCEEVLQMKKLNNSWDKMVKHARECCLTDSHDLIAYRNEAANVVLFFNCVYDLVGAEFAGDYVSRDNFDAVKKALANEVKERARDELDSAPFTYVMNGSLPVRDYLQQGEGTPQLGHQQPSTSIPAAVTKALTDYLRHAPRYKLMFRNGLSKDVFTKKGICAANGDPLKICLESNQQGNSSCRLLSAKIKIVVLDGNFNRDSEDYWTSEDFRRHIVRPRDKAGVVLTGELELSLKNGEADLRDATFIDNSKFMRSGKFRLGVMIADELGERVLEGITEPFNVKERRGEGYQKHIIPTLDDDVWRLKKISKYGVFHETLKGSGIFSVKDFLRSYSKDEHALRKVLTKATKLVWTTIVDHAKMCYPGKELYSFILEGHDVVLFFNSFYQIIGVTTGDQYTPFKDLNKPMQDQVGKWSKIAYYILSYSQPDYEMDNGKPRPVSQSNKRQTD